MRSTVCVCVCNRKCQKELRARTRVEAESKKRANYKCEEINFDKERHRVIPVQSEQWKNTHHSRLRRQGTVRLSVQHVDFCTRHLEYAHDRSIGYRTLCKSLAQSNSRYVASPSSSSSIEFVQVASSGKVNAPCAFSDTMRHL